VCTHTHTFFYVYAYYCTIHVYSYYAISAENFFFPCGEQAVDRAHAEKHTEIEGFLQSRMAALAMPRTYGRRRRCLLEISRMLY
jgi:hypothetical protein